MEQVKRETIKMEETRKQPSKSEVIGYFIGLGMVGFCFGIGLMLAVKTVNNLECCINRKCLSNGRRKSSNQRTTRRSHASATNKERTTRQTAMNNYKEPKESRSW